MLKKRFLVQNLYFVRKDNIKMENTEKEKK